MDIKILEGKKREAVDNMKRKKRKLLTAEREYRMAKAGVKAVNDKLKKLTEPKPEPVEKPKRTYTYKRKKTEEPVTLPEESESEEKDAE